ncbi:hypothetical protein PVT67_09515 [Gallaecimonas kandeliae]|uniref:hypothetical protein n=1 Tax=Gallaecimonas kandeliae TaxID=3029055 RepID=UPI00264867C2|nr:hypothetical protein [Gallaecimonas kandeliae]WKE63938.1 hypothetical protein PVT67_09515 [Gallaecimonas kandeliae]
MKWLGLLLFCALPAFAQWQLVGQGRYQYLFWDLYQARYYRSDQGQALALRYLKHFDADDIVSQTGKEWRHLGLFNPDWLAWFQAHCPNVRKGDELRLEVLPSQSRLYFNGTLVATNGSPGFGPAFLAIWLSPETRAPGLRKALLGKE